MTRKVSLEAEVLFLITVPVVAKVDVTMRGESDNSAEYEHVLRKFFTRKALPSLIADVENVQLEDMQIAVGKSPFTFAIDQLWGNMQDIVADNLESKEFPGELLNAKVTDSH